MKLIFLSALLICLALASEPAKNPSNINIAVEYDTLDTFKIVVVKRLLEENLDKLQVKGPIEDEINGTPVTIANIKVLALSLDWKSSHLLTRTPRSDSTIILNDVKADVQFDFDFEKGGHHSTKENVLHLNMDMTIGLGFGSTMDKVYFTQITYHDIPKVKRCEVDFKANKWLMKIIQKVLGPFIRPTVTKQIRNGINKANTTLVEKTSTPIIVKNQTDPIELRMALVNLPRIIIDELHNENRTFQAFNWNIEAYKNDKKLPFPNNQEMFDNYTNFAPIQIIINDEILEIAIHTLYEKNMVNKVLDETSLGEDPPIVLRTTDMTILFPHLEEDYGKNKGVYVKITKGGDSPVAMLSDGRLAVKLPLNIDFFADVDSSKYPKQGLDECTKTSCQKAITLDATLFLTAAIYRMDDQHIGLRFLNLMFPELEVTSGNVVGKDLKILLNKLLINIVNKLNSEKLGGIPMPEILTKYGFNATNVMIDADRLVVGLDLAPPKDNSKLIDL